MDIFHLAPHDRYNYGDLLYGYLLKKELEKSGYNIYFVGLIDVDMTEYGLGKVISVSKMIELYNKSKNAVLLIGGGEFLGAGYEVLSSFISKNKDIVIDKSFKHPFIVDVELFKNKPTIKYLSFGGMLRSDIDYIAKMFNESDFIQTRDFRTYKNLIDCGVNDGLISIAADICEKTSLLLPNNNKLNMGTPFEDYVVFQVGERKFKSIETIVSQLNQLSEKENIVLLPLGHCNRHNDYKLLRTIKNKIPKNNVYLHDSKDIESITTIIGNAKMNIGTSLHLMIVSRSYKIKYLPINEIEKIVNYQETWYDTKVNFFEHEIVKGYEWAKNYKYKFNKIKTTTWKDLM